MDDALYDRATGLPNHELLLDRLDVAVKRSHRTREPVGLLHVGIDGVEADAGSPPLASHSSLDLRIARRLSATVRADDSVARLGPQLFATLSAGDLDERALRLLAGRLLFALAPPFLFSTDGYFVTASVGGAIYHPERDLVCALPDSAALALATARGVRDVVIHTNDGQLV